MRINPGVHVLEVSPGARQLGIGEGSLLLRNLQAADLAFLAALRRGVPDGTEPAAASALSLSADRAASMLEVLEPLLVRQEATSPPVPSLRAERLHPDTQRLASAYAANGEETVRHRAAAAVLVEGLGRTGALLARTLASAGIGTLLLADPAAVGPSDVGPSYAMTDIGMNRAAAVKRHLFRIDPTLQVLVHTGTRVRPEPPAVDLVVQVSGIGPARSRPPGLPAPADGVPRLVLSAQEGGWDVGPLVVPGATACLECLDLSRADTDPGWFAAADALARQGEGPVDGAECSSPDSVDCSGPDGEETAGSVLAAGAAATAALVFLDGINRPALYSAVLRLRASDGYSRLQHLDYHPACGCRLQHRLNRVA